jgi:hypothetical protein
VLSLSLFPQKCGAGSAKKLAPLCCDYGKAFATIDRIRLSEAPGGSKREASGEPQPEDRTWRIEKDFLLLL